jgi:hypothetical protein
VYRRLALLAPVAPVLAALATVIAAIVAALDAFADDGRRPDDRRGPRDRCSDHASAPYTSSR